MPFAPNRPALSVGAPDTGMLAGCAAMMLIMALHGDDVPDRTPTGPRGANAFLGVANPALEREINPPLNALAQHQVPADVAYQLVHDELLLDGSARLNLATFVTTWMEPQAQQLMDECSDKNMIDKDEYPQTAAIENRCVAILADLWHAPESGVATGCSTTGSSEACMLAGMALKRRWAARIGPDSGRRPNLVMGANVQVCWEKFCRYWEVEPRLVPVEGDRLHLGAAEAASHCDENTIGVVAVLGSTFDGSYEPVAAIAAARDQLAAAGGPDVPMHVDAASGGMVAPFLDPDLVWDFRLPRVASINTSGHKYGLVYPGVGWAIWRDAEALPKELVFDVNYLGGNMPTFALNFSRPGAQVIAQYYTFFRLGFEGYAAVQQASRDVATSLSGEIEQLGPYRLITRGDELPVFAFTTTDAITEWDVFAVSRGLREHGWQVPAYTFPQNRTDLAVLRVVCRHGFSRDLGDLFLRDLRTVTEALIQDVEKAGNSGPTSFHH